MLPRGTPRIGLLWRGDRRSDRGSERADRMLGPLFAASHELEVRTDRVVYADDAVDDVKRQLLDVDGVLVWVNPIQDGASRAQLDGLLREVSAHGVWVSTHPDVISRQARGTAGNGVWRVELADALSGPDAYVRLLHAQLQDGVVEEMKLDAFVERLGEYFAWSGSLVVQPYQWRLPEGMIRCYLTHDKVIGFATSGREAAGPRRWSTAAAWPDGRRGRGSVPIAEKQSRI